MPSLSKRKYDLSNQRYGKILVKNLSEIQKYNQYLWECVCDCGTVCYDTTQNLRTGHRLSCGCNKIQSKDLTNFKSGMLTVLKFSHIRKYDELHSERVWVCQCECGNITELPTAVITKSVTKSCGCLLKRDGQNNKSWSGYQEISGSTWGQIRNCGSVRNLEFTISIEYAWEIFIKQERKCAISGIPLTFCIKVTKDLPSTASLDRIDSSKGYIEGNVQWVHKDINRIKSDFDQSYFIQLCNLVSYHNNNK